MLFLFVKEKKKKKKLLESKIIYKIVMNNFSSWVEMEGCLKYFWFFVIKVSFYRLRL